MAVIRNDSGAVFSACRRWRYLLWRRWDAAERFCTDKIIPQYERYYTDVLARA